MELAVAKGALTIAEGYLVIDKNQLEELSKEALTAKSWTLSDLQARLPRKNGDWIIKHIIDNPKFSRDIQKMRDDRVIIGGGRGSNWKFQASVFGPWLDEHWKDIKW
ncbi:DUF771 domain-containing protein [Loigolactobacillus coryniformis subsp. coryniformis]|uniref:DUF771 domain-containing protein n=1 Tax=Loigolactobacillus coryniformis TaxID=1610 RepID=UPI002891105F|nr:DUF771 domain-containing protein [Bacillota bacterium]